MTKSKKKNEIPGTWYLERTLQWPYTYIYHRNLLRIRQIKECDTARGKPQTRRNYVNRANTETDTNHPGCTNERWQLILIAVKLIDPLTKFHFSSMALGTIFFFFWENHSFGTI